jgi:hypothetical protein
MEAAAKGCLFLAATPLIQSLWNAPITQGGNIPQPNFDSNDEYRTRNIELRSGFSEVFTSAIDLRYSAVRF